MVVGRKTPNTHPHGLSPPLVFPHLFDRTARAGYTLLFRRGFWNGGNWRLREKRVTSRQERQTTLSFLQRNPLVIGSVLERQAAVKSRKGAEQSESE